MVTTGDAARGRTPTGNLLRDGGRAFGGALIFALPLLMTMEMWWLGFYIDPLRLAVLVAVTLPLLVGLASRIGFDGRGGAGRRRRRAVRVRHRVLTSAVILLVLGVIGSDMSRGEIVGKITVQTIPASIGALLARSQFGGADGER